MRTRVGTAATTVALLLGAGAAPRAQQTGSGEVPVFRTKVELVTVDVGVIDKRGQPVHGLAASDFVVTVDGEPRQVVTAEFVDAAGTRAGAARQPDAAPVSTNEGAGVGRQFVFIVDEHTLEPGQLRQVADAASRLLGGLSFADRSALMRLPNGPGVEFTWAHDRVQDALRRVVGASTLRGESEFTSLSEAREIANGGPRALRNLGYRECDGLSAGGFGGGSTGPATGTPATQGGTTNSPGAPEGGRAGGPGSAPASGASQSAGGVDSGFGNSCTRDLQRRAEWTWRNAQMTSLSSLAGLRAALAALSGVPGDKTVILVSGGWPLDEWEEHSLVAQVAADAAKARATIFTLFVPATSGAPIYRMPPRTPVDDQLLQSRPLETLAGLTGGGSFRAYVGAETAFERIAHEVAAYYRIGVEKSITDNGGKSRRLKVRVLRGGATVRAREMFDVQTYEDRDWAGRLASALDAPVVATGIGLRVTSYLAADPNDSANLQLVLAGEASRVGQGETTFKLLVKDLEGRKVASAEPPVGQPTDDGLVFSTRFPLPPGSYVVRVAMMDGTGRTGSVDHRVDVRQESLGDIQATGPILVRVPTDPQRRPSLALSDTRQDEKLAMQVHLRGEESRLANPDVTFEIAGSADGPALVEAAADVSSRSPGGWVVGQAVADLRVLPPGPYVVRARVTADGLPLGQVHRAFVVAGAAASPGAAAAPTAAAGGVPGTSRRPFTPLMGTGPRFAVSTALAPPVLGTFLDRVAARPDAGAPVVRDLVERARTSGVEQLVVSETLAAEQPVAAFLRGLTLLSRNELDPAANAFRSAMRVAADFYPAMVYLGVCYAAGGKDKDAAAAWRTALIKEGDTRALHLLLTDALLRQQQGELALRAVDNARARWPADDELKRRFVMAALLAGRYADGLQALDELVDTHAEDESTLAAGLLVLYESFERGDPVQDVEGDRARMTRLAEAYRELGGPSVALVDAWLETARKR